MKRAIVVASALGLAAFACQVVAGIERTDKTEAPAAPTPDAEPDAGVPDPCAHAGVPPIPDKDDDPGGSLGAMYLAVRTMTFTPKDADGGYVGFDLDGVCSCDTRPGSAEGGASSCVPSPKADVCDSDNGVDNQFARLLDPYASTALDVNRAGDLGPNIARGRVGIIAYLADYNGQPNDRDVKVGLILSNGIADPSGCNNVEDPPLDPTTGPRYQPKWCGSDIWTVDPRTTLLPPKIPTAIGGGYVNDGELVVQGEGVTLYLGSLPIELNSYRLRGKLRKVGSSWHLDDAVVAGRVPVPTFLGALGTIVFGDPVDGKFLCLEALWSTVRSTLCQNADLAESSRFDFQGRPCAALSLAFAFSAESAAVGAAAAAVDDPNPCAPDAAPPDSYVCPP